MQKSYIWSLPTRVFHWLFVLFILLAFLSADEDRWLNYHAIIGYGVLILLVFRIFWGIFGPKYSLFKDFPIGKQNVKDFLNNIFEDHQKYIGHNPLASYVMIAMLIVAFLTVITGVLAFGIQEGKGILSSWNSPFFKEMEIFKGIHEIFSTLFLVLIGAHITGVLSDRLLHKKHETLNSIFTGFKVTIQNETVKLNIFQKIFAFFMFILFIGFLAFNFYKPNNILVSSIYKPIDYQTQNKVFVTECASCHTLYPSQYFA